MPQPHTVLHHEAQATALASRPSLWPHTHPGSHVHVGGRCSGSWREPGQGPISLRASAQHKGSRQRAGPTDDNSRLTISWLISSSALNTDMEMGACKQFELKSQPLANRKNCSSNRSSPTQERTTRPKVSILGWVFSKIVKEPTYLPILWCLQEQTDLTERDAPNHIWFVAQLEPAHRLLPHGSLQNNRSPRPLQLRDRRRWETTQKPPVGGSSFWLGIHK